jgi:hypothetical protein
MEMSHGNFQCSYLKQKMSFFFSFTKLEEGKTGPAWGVGTSVGQRAGVGESVKEGECSANTMYTCMKMEK